MIGWNNINCSVGGSSPAGCGEEGITSDWSAHLAIKASAKMSDDLKPKIQEHYDEISPYYHDLWGR
jgi:hypothetical protein